MPSFDASEVFPPQGAWNTNFTAEEQEWWDWVLDTAEEQQRFPSWINLQRMFRREFGKDAPSDKVIKRLLKEDLRESGRGEWIDAK